MFSPRCDHTLRVGIFEGIFHTLGTPPPPMFIAMPRHYPACHGLQPAQTHHYFLTHGIFLAIFLVPQSTESHPSTSLYFSARSALNSSVSDWISASLASSLRA